MYVRAAPSSTCDSGERGVGGGHLEEGLVDAHLGHARQVNGPCLACCTGVTDLKDESIDCQTASGVKYQPAS